MTEYASLAPLVDGCGRRIDYLRLSVTDRCDLRCSYCMPRGAVDYADPATCLSVDELERVTRLLARMGVHRVRLTGGEPLVRANILELVRRVAAVPGIEDFSLSTNATALARHAEGLRRAGLRRVNVSLDTLDPQRFARITGRAVLHQVLAGLEAARAVGLAPVKVNMVVMRGENDDEIEPMVRYCMERGLTLRFIESMPMGETGRTAAYLDLQPVQARLRERFDLVDAVMPGGGPARYLASRDGRFSVGFITPLSRHFCATCNRLRLGADGRLFTCLGHEEDGELRTLLRSGAGDTALEHAIRAAVARKPERHEFGERRDKVVRIMAATGG